MRDEGHRLSRGSPKQAEDPSRGLSSSKPAGEEAARQIVDSLRRSAWCEAKLRLVFVALLTRTRGSHAHILGESAARGMESAAVASDASLGAPSEAPIRS